MMPFAMINKYIQRQLIVAFQRKSKIRRIAEDKPELPYSFIKDALVATNEKSEMVMSSQESMAAARGISMLIT
jgi:hypothetical protein